MCTAEEVAHLCVYLASDEVSAVQHFNKCVNQEGKDLGSTKAFQLSLNHQKTPKKLQLLFYFSVWREILIFCVLSANVIQNLFIFLCIAVSLCDWD